MITSPMGIITVIVICVALTFWSQKIPFFKAIGPLVPAVVMGVVLSNTGIMPMMDEHGIYIIILTYFVPIALPMILMTVDIRSWVKLSKEPLIAMGIAILVVSVVTTIAGIIIAPHVEEGWKVAGMFVGTYTGGSPNLTAIGIGLDASSTTVALANAADYVIGMPVLLLFTILPAILKKWKGFQKFWPNQYTDEELATDGETDLFAPKEWGIRDIAALLAIGFTVNLFCTWVSDMLPVMLASPVKIILITTISLILGQIPAVRKLKGNIDLGYLICMFFQVVIGMTICISDFIQSASYIVLMCAIVIIGSCVIHIIICRLAGIKYQIALGSMIASIADGSYGALILGGAGWGKLIPTALIMGAIGEALGNYIGIGIAFLIKIVTGA